MCAALPKPKSGVAASLCLRNPKSAWPSAGLFEPRMDAKVREPFSFSHSGEKVAVGRMRGRPPGHQTPPVLVSRRRCDIPPAVTTRNI